MSLLRRELLHPWPRAVIVAKRRLRQGHAEGDGFFGIEVSIGSAFDDFLVGNDDRSVLQGGENGNDVLYGLGGDDELEGGAGADTSYGSPSSTASYANSTRPSTATRRTVTTPNACDAEGDLSAEHRGPASAPPTATVSLAT